MVLKPAKLEDRRVARTRNRLQDALVALIVEKGYDAITVQDILDKADVGRSTFYAHFLDKQDLLMGGLERLKAALAEQQQAALKHPGTGQARAGSGATKGRPFAFSLPMLLHVKSHHRLYKAFVGRQSGTMVMLHIQRILADLARDEITARVPAKTRNALSRIPIEAVVQSTVGAYLALLVWWMDHKAPCTAEELDAMFQRLVLPGITALELQGSPAR
ncbi:MAG: TetR/AcrR family transcriptional regulator [Holophagaceae bacterium]|nr:TetR/AcrR family transcriptional regulator [Holophagaceae bacterium]